MQKRSIKNILKKKNKTPITCLTAYSKSMAKIVDKYCDIILVGDSLGMVVYGMKNTRKVKIDTMIMHAKAVKKFSKRSLVVFDMPHLTYKNKFLAYKNAKKVIRLTGCDAIKLEGGTRIAEIIKHLVERGISVMGHVGLLPQTSKNFKARGKSPSERKKIFDDAKAISRSGAFAVVVECVVESLAKKITKNISIPTIGIGSSKYCDGQILVTEDMIGMNDFSPKFVKQYGKINKDIEKCVKKYVKDVKIKKFPFNNNVYR
tara:strand:- start:1833 stop:2612 length:780 start_codon:yes stop_codon:yes gene_type:complete